MSTFTDIRPCTIAEATGVEFEEITKAIATQKAVRDTVHRLKETKIPTNLPASIFHKICKAVDSSTRGLLAQRFAARLFGYTLDEQDGRGDATDAYGERVELKFAMQDKRGRFSAKVRPHDQVSRHDIVAVTREGEYLLYRIPQAELSALRGSKSRDLAGSVFTQWSLNSRHANSVAAYRVTDTEISDRTTGSRFGATQFLAEAGIDEADLDQMLSVQERVVEAFEGHGKNVHLSLGELLTLRTFFEVGKFGLVWQDWLNDHLEIAHAGTPGIGDGRGRGGQRIEAKYATKNRRNKFHVNAIRLGQFDDIYIALNHENDEDGFEVFRLSHKAMSRLLGNYGMQTAPGVFSLDFVANGPLIQRLRRNNKVDLSLDLH